MSRTVLVRFVAPAPIKIRTDNDATRVREWDGEKMAAFLHEGLKIWAGDRDPDFEMRVLVPRRAEIGFENWKPQRKEAEELRAEIGEEISQVMEGIGPEDDLSEWSPEV